METISVLITLAVVLNDLGESDLSLSPSGKSNLDIARKHYQRALKEYEKVFGPDHPDSLSLVYNLALLAKKLGDVEAGNALYSRALEGFEKVLGSDHNYTRMAARLSKAFTKRR
jgi:tetratricopeptide (TPR) repeat protein